MFKSSISCILCHAAIENAYFICTFRVFPIVCFHALLSPIVNQVWHTSITTMFLPKLFFYRLTVETYEVKSTFSWKLWDWNEECYHKSNNLTTPTFFNVRHCSLSLSDDRHEITPFGDLVIETYERHKCYWCSLLFLLQRQVNTWHKLWLGYNAASLSINRSIWDGVSWLCCLVPLNRDGGKVNLWARV